MLPNCSRSRLLRPAFVIDLPEPTSTREWLLMDLQLNEGLADYCFYFCFLEQVILHDRPDLGRSVSTSRTKSQYFSLRVFAYA